MIPVYLSPYANHLWQSTLFAGIVGLLTLTLRKNHAQARYALWLTASVKFLLPFSLLVSLGSQFEWSHAPEIAPPLTAAIEQLGRPFTPPLAALAVPAAPPTSPWFPAMLAVLWISGSIAVAARWWMRWRSVRAALRTATRLPIGAPVPVMMAHTRLEPGIFGVFRPVLLLPEGIVDRLTPQQFQAILAHEFCHVRRRDNQAAALHMLVEAIFWFHPIVWWLGARLVAERERACDEEVLRLGNAPHAYAQGILSVCKFYLESRLVCASGVTGADLKKRIEAIMSNRVSHRLTLARKFLLATAGAAAALGPFIIGIVQPQQTRAQSTRSPGQEVLRFEVASVKPADPAARGVRIKFTPGGGLDAQNVRVKQLIMMAYDVQSYQVSSGPSWLETQGFNILAKAPPSEGAYTGEHPITPEQHRPIQLRIQSLLAERFHLVIHRDSREAPVYALVVARNGHKLKASSLEDGLRADRGVINGEGATMTLLAGFLGGRIGRPVLDQTGLTARYDFKLEWTPEGGELTGKGGPEGPSEKAEAASDPTGPSLFSALQDQLGLRLESQKGQVETIVIERIEKPDAN